MIADEIQQMKTSLQEGHIALGPPGKSHVYSEKHFYFTQNSQQICKIRKGFKAGFNPQPYEIGNERRRCVVFSYAADSFTE